MLPDDWEPDIDDERWYWFDKGWEAHMFKVLPIATQVRVVSPEYVETLIDKRLAAFKKELITEIVRSASP
jgi:hypothetical protein